MTNQTPAEDHRGQTGHRDLEVAGSGHDGPVEFGQRESGRSEARLGEAGLGGAGLGETEYGARRPVRRWAVGAAAILVLPLLVWLSPAGGAVSSMVLGLLPALVALPAGPRVTAGTALSTAVVVFVGLLCSTIPGAAAVLLFLLGVAVAWSYLRGWQGPATYVATVGALATVTAPGSSLLPDAAASSAPSAAAVAGFALAGGLWVALTGRLVLHDLSRPAPEPLPRDELVLFAALLGVALGVGAFLAVSFAPGTTVWWVLLTVLIVLVPEHRATRQRAVWRAGGTILGGAAAGVIVVVVDNPAVVTVVGLLAVAATAVTYLRAPYWAFVTTMTTALVLVTMPADRALRGDAERVVYTVASAVLIVVASAVVHAVHDRFKRERT